MDNISVQAFATQRNGQAELLVDFLIGITLERLRVEGAISEFTEPEIHKQFKSDAISDIFDHFFTVTMSDGNQIQIWGQTTCYKGNGTSAPEPNKTYEIRETLIEGLGLRASLSEAGETFRTMHFTLGPSSYTYSWFPAAKDNAYDLSIYLPARIGEQDGFDMIAKLLNGVTTEFEVRQRFESALKAGLEGFDLFIEAAQKPIIAWFKGGLQTQPMADMQAALLVRERSNKNESLPQVIASSKNGGENIKGRALQLLRGESESVDPILIGTLERLLQGNPFLKNAIEALADWDGWVGGHIRSSNQNLTEYLTKLWNSPLPNRLVMRRLLVRLNTGEAVRYPADLHVAGITEHNLYNGNHTASQTSEIISKLANRYKIIKINTALDLNSVIQKHGKKLLKESLKLESYNGTSLKPSFLYVELALSATFNIMSFSDAKLEAPIAYYSQFGEFNVNPYSNMKVIVSKSTGKPLAIIKAKYFRKQEFPRRAKEESYVGLTTKYQLTDNEFTEKYNLPIIMFVDMDSELIPPEYSVTRLMTSGWEVFFSVNELEKYLSERETNDR